jgi:hypothetical protein
VPVEVPEEFALIEVTDGAAEAPVMPKGEVVPDGAPEGRATLAGSAPHLSRVVEILFWIDEEDSRE